MVRIPTQMMTADIFTQQLSNMLFKQLLKSLGVGPQDTPSPAGVGTTQGFSVQTIYFH
jgi:hypothetical protein